MKEHIAKLLAEAIAIASMKQTSAKFNSDPKNAECYALACKAVAELSIALLHAKETEK